MLCHELHAVCVLSVIVLVCVGVGLYSENMELPPLIILSSIWQFAAFPYVLAVGKATKL